MSGKAELQQEAEEGMSIADDMVAMADQLMADFGVPATYKASGDWQEVPVTVRCKPKRRMTNEGRTIMVMEISVRSSEVETPAFNDTFEIGSDVWRLSTLPMEFYEISSHAKGALWQLTLVMDARSTMRGGAA